MRVSVRYIVVAPMIALGAFIGSLAFSHSVSALSDDCWFNTRAGPVTGIGTCSVPGTAGNYGTNDLLRRGPNNRNTSGGGQAIPDSVNTKAEFINHVVSRYNGVANYTTQNKVGAAFIIQTMRGSRAWPDNADVNDWVRRMENPSVTVHVLTRNVGRTGYYDTSKHNAFFGAHTTVARRVIEVRFNGVVYAQIEYSCGNMVADRTVLPSPSWNITPSTVMRVNGTQRNNAAANPYDVRIGDQVQWTHTISSSGRDPTDQRVEWQSRQAVYDFTTGVDAPHTFPNTGHWTRGTASGSTWSRTNTRTLSINDANKRFCQMIQNNPNSSTVGGWENSDWRCVRVEDNRYQLRTTVDSTPGVFTDDLPNFSVTGRVDIASGRIIDGSRHEVRLVAYRYDNSSIKSSGQLVVRTSNANSPCQVPQLRNNGFVTCRDTQAEQPMSMFDSSSNPLNISAPFSAFGYDEDGDYPLGTTFCFMLSVQNPTQDPSDDSRWYHSVPQCSTRAKQPQLQAHGGDIRAAGGSMEFAQPARCNAGLGDKGFIRTSFTRANSRYFGSWSEFATLSRCSNLNLTTGAKLDDGVTSPGSAAQYSIAFANTPSYGSYAERLSTKGVEAITECPAGIEPETYADFVDDNDTDSVEGVHCVTGSNITISDDIILDNNPDRLSLLPQVIIIAGTIRIDEGVRRIDAWLIADGTGASNGLYTCVNSSGNRYDRLSSGRCNRQLIINGPVVVANNLYADRTFGSGNSDDRGKAAEVFNLPASTALWWYQWQSKNTARITTVSLKELAPRY